MPGAGAADGGQPGQTLSLCWCSPWFASWRIVFAPDDGALTFAAESALPGSPTHISTDHRGQFVFVGSYNAGNVSVTRLEDGLPVGVVDVVEGLDGCHSANISPDNRTLWVPAWTIALPVCAGQR